MGEALEIPNTREKKKKRKKPKGPPLLGECNEEVHKFGKCF